MIRITSKTGRNLDEICDHHCNQLMPLIKNKVLTLNLSQRQQDYLSIDKNLENILRAKPDVLLEENRKYIRFCTSITPTKRGIIKNYNNKLSSIFNYKQFSSKSTPGYSAYHLTERLGVSTCPYCNRNYITTVHNTTEKIIRPDIDHFHAKSDYPLLGLSFYNLIPSCLVCNRTLKGKKKVQSCLNPYAEGFSDTMRFNFYAKDVASAKGEGNAFEVTFLEDRLSPTKVSACLKNIELFKLKEIYEMSHGHEIAEIVRKHEMTGGRYLEVLQNTFPRLGTLDELYKIAFGNYYVAEDHEKRPLAKLTRDTVDQLKFVLPVKFKDTE